MRDRVSPDLVHVADVIASSGGRLGRPLHLSAETASTNDDAKAGARSGEPHGAVWLTEAQSQGRGRQGRAWLASPGEALLFSVLLRLSCPPARVPPLSLVVGLAVRDALARAVGSEADRVLVKWPNDVVVRARSGRGLRKIAGILVESALVGSKVEYVVVGVGINVHARTFPDALADLATSVAIEGSEPPDRARILADVLRSLDHDVEHVAHRGLGLVHARLAKHDALLGAQVESEDGSLVGVADGIDPDGRLRVRHDGGVTPVSSGEVRLVRRA